MTDANARVNALASGEVDGGWMVPLGGRSRSCRTRAPATCYFGLTTAVVEPHRQQPRGSARRPAGAPGAAHGARSRGHRRGRGRGHRRGHRRAHDRVGLGRRRATPAVATAFDDVDDVPVRPRRGEGARRGGRRRRRGDRASSTAPISSDFAVISQATAAAARVDRPDGDDRDGHAERVHGAVLRPERARGHRPLLHELVPVEPRPARDVRVLRTGEFSNYGGWSDPEFDEVVNEAIGDRRPRRAQRRDRRRPSRSRTSSCRGCRCTPRRCRSSSASGSPASRRRSRSCTTRGRRPLAPGSGAVGARPTGGRGRDMTAVRRVAGKLGGLLLTLFLASLLVFFSRFLVPGDPVELPAPRPQAERPRRSREVTAQYGLDLPPWQQYLNWLGGVLHGDFGRSLQYRQDVTDGHRRAAARDARARRHGGHDDRRRRARRRHRRRAQPRPRARPRRARRPHDARRDPVVRRLDRAHRGVRGAARLVPVVRLGRGLLRHRLPPGAAVDRARDRVHRARRQGDALGDGRAARPRARRGRDEPRADARDRRPPPRLPQRALADPHRQRHPRRRAFSSRARSSSRPSGSPASARCSCSRSTGSTSRSCRRSSCSS